MNGRQLSLIRAVGAASIAASLAACGSSGQQSNSNGLPGANVAQPGTSTLPTTNTGVAGTSVTPITNMMPPPIGTAGAGTVTPPAGTAGVAAPTGTAGTGAPMAMGTAGTAPMTMGMGGAAAPGTNPLSLYNAATKELAAPAAGDGVQITTTPFDLAPGDEKFACYHAEIPIDGTINVHYWESKMAEGSHHFILYTADGDTSPVGTMDQTGCLTAFGGWIYSSAQPHIDLSMPDGVAMPLSSRQRVQFDMHYINVTQQTLHAQVTLNVTLAKGMFQQAKSLISYNSQIFIPANGTQTVGGDCTPGAGAKFFYMLTHTHRRGKLATITRVLANGMMGEQLVKSTDWEVPMERKWLTDPYLTFQPGEKFHYSCDYMNDLPMTVTSGPSAQTNEMCMAITYYFPASAGGSCF